MHVCVCSYVCTCTQCVPVGNFEGGLNWYLLETLSERSVIRAAISFENLPKEKEVHIIHCNICHFCNNSNPFHSVKCWHNLISTSAQTSLGSTLGNTIQTALTNVWHWQYKWSWGGTHYPPQVHNRYTTWGDYCWLQYILQHHWNHILSDEVRVIHFVPLQEQKSLEWT